MGEAFGTAFVPPLRYGIEPVPVSTKGFNRLSRESIMTQETRTDSAVAFYEAVKSYGPNGECVQARIWPDGDWSVFDPSGPATDRKAFEAEITDWLIGIADHADNEVERDLLSSLIESIREGEYIPAPTPPHAAPGPSNLVPLNCPF